MKALILLAEGVEEMEAVIVIDTLRRAGASVVTAGLRQGPITASRNVRLLADQDLDAVEGPREFDLLILPGGLGGTKQLCCDPRVSSLVQHYASAPGRFLACICAAALVLDAAGVLVGRRFTCHPSVSDRIATGTRLDNRVVIDGSLTSSQGPGTAFEFALSLIQQQLGADVAVNTAGPMLL